MTLPDLRDVLREHGDGPSPANPARHEQVRARIRRIRLRRSALGGGAVVAVAAAVALVVSLLPGTAEPRREAAGETTTVATQPAAELPERFTAADGTEYRRIATMSIKKTGPTKVSVTIPVSGKPLDLGAVCAGPHSGAARASTGAGGPPSTVFTVCSKRMELRPLQVPPSTSDTKLTVTFDTTTTGWGCTVRNGKCVPQKETRGVWALAVYEWTPPTQPVEPPPLKDLPDHSGKARLTETKTGVWPQDTSATFKVRGKVGFDSLCTGDLADRLWYSFEVNGRVQPSSSACAVWKGNAFRSAATEFTYPTDRTTTVKVTWKLLGGGTNRPVRWSVGHYRK
ncbi:hypothetical protein AB0F17_03020 [Nonomuraea sp. NPDC026600]|uniref:hypothetical protein n=1 Tax=Nonomuraea sp. NPDC026600 TaxID=3155363 RepID=UPI0033F13D32